MKKKEVLNMLIKAAAKDHNSREARRLMRIFKGVLWNVANGFPVNDEDKKEFVDTIGNQALLDAVDNYREEKGEFSGLVNRMSKNAMIEALPNYTKSLIRIPEKQLRLHKHFEEAVMNLDWIMIDGNGDLRYSCSDEEAIVGIWEYVKHRKKDATQASIRALLDWHMRYESFESIYSEEGCAVTPRIEAISEEPKDVGCTLHLSDSNISDICEKALGMMNDRQRNVFIRHTAGRESWKTISEADKAAGIEKSEVADIRRYYDQADKAIAKYRMILRHQFAF